MAEKVVRTLVDDMEAKEVEADAGTVLFGLDGKDYEIDLSKKNADPLRSFMKKYIEHARPMGRTGKAPAAPKPAKTGAASGYGREQLAAAREWARRNGYPDLSNKGRVPAEVLLAYENAHRTNGEQLFSS